MVLKPFVGAVLATLVLDGLASCQGAPKDAPKPAAAPAQAAPRSGAVPVVVKRDNPCSVLLPSEAGEILGTPITMREIMDEETCHFDYDKPAGGPPYFEMKVHYEGGRTVMAAWLAAGKLLGGADAGFEKLSGIGDEAWLGPMASALVFRQGDAAVELDLRLVPNGREKGIRMAKLVAGRLAAAR